jgi:hypothetical protein
MDLTNEDLTILLRSLLRSIEKTPPSERARHKAVYDKIAAESARRMPREELAKLGRAIGHAIGE